VSILQWKQMRPRRSTDPLTGRTVPLFNPRRDRWRQHFRWSADRLRILGRTDAGRATVAALNMNRTGATVIRAMLLELQLHPTQQILD
jgi:hypothetical protein